jgi:hypothetical protein
MPASPGIYWTRVTRICIWNSVLSYQDQDSLSPTFGIWPYYAEEPLDSMINPDWNWADFIGVELLESYMRHYDVLPDSLKAKMEDAIIDAAFSIMRRDVKPGYTNIAIMGTLVTQLAARLFDIPELQEYADMRLKRFYDYTRELGGFEEYNSPTYTVVALDELMRMKQYLLEREALEMVDYCYTLAWEELATHFHPPTAQLGGPHSRSYSTLLRQDFYNLLYTASSGEIRYGHPRENRGSYKLKHRIPDDLVPRFKHLDAEALVIDTFSMGPNPVVGTTWLHPACCLGTANRSTTWEQRRPWILYWGSDTVPRYLRVRLLHDYVDFGVGNIFSVQDHGRVLSALNFATDGGDYHLLLDRIRDGHFRASDLRLRFECSPAGLSELMKVRNSGFTFSDEGIRLSLNMLHAEFGILDIRIETGRDERNSWVDWVIYGGPETDFFLTALNRAVFGWYMEIIAGPPQSSDRENDREMPTEAESRISGENLLLQSGNLFLSVPVKPGREENLQSHWNSRTD